MEYRNLGGSGCSVSAFALGTMTFGNTTSEADSFTQLDRFVEVGGTLVDTADVYVGGESEKIIGRWLADRPDEITDRVVLATKGRFPTSEEPNGAGLSRRHLDRALTASLRRLAVDAIDLYQVHAWDPVTPIEETLSFLDSAVRAGKIRYVGLSNFTGWQVQKTVDVAEFGGFARPVTLQPQYSLLCREIEWEIVPSCEENGLGLLPWSPLAGGVLTGKYEQGAKPAEDTRLAEERMALFFAGRTQEQRTWDVVDTLRQIAQERDSTPSRIALAWVAGRPAVSSVILGARTVEQLADNLGAVDLVLTEKEEQRLTAASEVSVDYPYGGMALQQRTRPLAGGWPARMGAGTTAPPR
ncbi:aldo/keto reductase [Kutzneria viridogrisea]|uniref:Aryl-alcohol dehydrogenase (NADP(+)) n=2 Tax=Kutzneria TaxID=43356 RepID=W5VY42_9PSEU|nr:aldo/keto reductase [Kutzneria albida]AHH93487.1 aryl-alcohol dehydrogenase (NADP(+)) [Kutzneria albida DSM 43870]MBA8929127.1 aryl-alcohol dehydrogenase-like predicted oxidoreductase [Kutzneria viridogrisea]